MAVAGFLSGAAPTDMQLTTNGLGRVRYGMAVGQVEAALGQRLSVNYPQDKSCGVGALKRPHNPTIHYLFEQGRLARIEVGASLARKQRPLISVKGIGIGASEAAALKRFPSAKVEPHKYDEDGHYVEINVTGRRGILFETHKGRVAAMRTGLYPALLYVEGCL
ncbi:hypothetical protein [Sandarakinorhabdus sp.]|uniref:hypothetical protein n=1 Tax=Sandarakinorhabdus sp. TaxID=1916663 RepID=UPI00333F125C